jgi:PTH2 family peptidyl-tRNA hydrolase
MAKDEGLPCALITDAGKTVIAPGTKTAVGIGPAKEEDIDRLTQDLKLL